MVKHFEENVRREEISHDEILFDEIDSTIQPVNKYNVK